MRHLPRVLRFLRPYLEPAVAVVFLLLWAIAETGRHQILPGARSASLPWWAALVLLCLAIGLSRLQPLVSMGLVAVMLIGQLVFPVAVFSDSAAPIYGGLLYVVAMTALSAGPRWRALSAGFALFAAVGTAGLLAAYGWLDSVDRVGLFVVLVLLAAAAWVLPQLVRAWWRRRFAEVELLRTGAELRQAEVELIVAAERDRIAQDVHDVMAHSLAVILAQADGARFLAERRPEAAVASLEVIAGSARDSLTEVRMLIENLVAEPDGHSLPGTADLDELFGRMRTAGLAVEVQRFGDGAELTGTQELAVYRILQESLTNALRHAGTGPVVRIALDSRGPGLAVTVSSEGVPVEAGAGTEAGTDQGTGRGVLGMRERARVAGGWLEAGPGEEPGSYLVTAFIPVAAAVAS